MRETPTAKPLVTVITAAYNVAPFIGETVASVRRQSFERFEYIIVDDGSTDETTETAAQAAAGDPRIRIVSISHRGPGAARNAGLREAQGDFIAFIDGDDMWTTDALTMLLEGFRQAPAGVGAVFGHTVHIGPAGAPLSSRSAPPQGVYDLERMFAGNCPPGNGSCLLVKSSCFYEAGGFDEDIPSAGDHEMWLRIARDSADALFYCTPHVVAKYRVRQGSISANVAAKVAGHGLIFERYGALLLPSALGKAKIYPAVMAFSVGDARAREWGWSALRRAPLDVLGTVNGRRLVARLVGAVWVRDLARSRLRRASLKWG